MELRVTKLAVMHDGYRLTPEAMCSMLASVGSGVVLNSETLAAHDPAHNRPIAIVRFEDARLFLRDGLHRATAIMLQRPSQALLPEEYVIEEMSYSMFLRANLAAGFYTPFDPRREVRVADWAHFREEVTRRLNRPDQALQFIESRRTEYVRPRRPFHDSLADFFLQRNAPYAGSE